MHNSVFYCSVCRTHSEKFIDFGMVKKRSNAQCPNCGSLERHRLLWLTLEKIIKENDKNKIDTLHLAPDACIMNELSDNPRLNYISGDLNMGKSSLIIDLNKINIRDDKFDLIICSHVLEHVPDDIKAMRELFRILRRGGVAVIMVPLRGDKTYEDFSVTTPEERTKHFGQHDHVRIYGMDIITRLQKGGFNVEVYPDKNIGSNAKLTLKLINAQSNIVFICKKN